MQSELNHISLSGKLPHIVHSLTLLCLVEKEIDLDILTFLFRGPNFASKRNFVQCRESVRLVEDFTTCPRFALFKTKARETKNL